MYLPLMKLMRLIKEYIITKRPCPKFLLICRTSMCFSVCVLYFFASIQPKDTGNQYPLFLSFLCTYLLLFYSLPKQIQSVILF